MENGYIDMWDSWSKKRDGKPAYDLWLENFKELLVHNGQDEILDLGCGIGANTLYLTENGYNVLSCDFSMSALKNVEKYIPNSKTKYLDMMKKFPLLDNSYSLVIADLSLHYFSNDVTIHIMNEIKRILKNKGVLLARVASIKDFNYGAGYGEVLEENYYFEGNYTKRFFDIDDVYNYFGIIGNVYVKETSMTRNDDVYKKVKMLYQIKVVKGEK